MEATAKKLSERQLNNYRAVRKAGNLKPTESELLAHAEWQLKRIADLEDALESCLESYEDFISEVDGAVPEPLLFEPLAETHSAREVLGKARTDRTGT